jgi:hypothetical protein
MVLFYVEWHVAWMKVLEVDPAAEWEVIAIQPAADGFMCHGRVTVGGVTRDGIGYAPTKGNDVDCGVKDAESDALKRACAKHGVGIGLYDKDSPERTGGGSSPAPQRESRQAAPQQEQRQSKSNGGGGSEWPSVGKACFAIVKSISRELDAHGVKEKDVWHWILGREGEQGLDDLSLDQWKDAIGVVGECQDRDRNKLPDQIEKFAALVNGKDFNGSLKDSEEPATDNADDEIPF